MSSAVDGGCRVYYSLKNPLPMPHLGGTRETSPIFSGVAAIADRWPGGGSATSTARCT